MTIYFECLGCGAVTAVEVPPPACGRCGSGTGITRPENLEEAAAPRDVARAPATEHGSALRRPSARDHAIPLALSNPELLLLEERCVDGEARCEQRAEAARQRGDYAAAAFEAQLREQYRRLRLKMRDRRDHERRPEESPDAQRLRRATGAQPAPREKEPPG